jgi:molybdenum cofactor guanylyltransferase
MKCGGIVLCGGRSSRMGLPKSALPFGSESMLERIVRLLGQAVKEIVVVAAPKQDLPELPAGTRIVRDRQEGRGPLEGLRAGLSALPAECQAAYVTGCDVPGLVPAFVTRMLDLLGNHSIAVPISGDNPHPLPAVYRRSVLDTIDRLLATDRRRLALLLDLVPTRRVSTVELADVDPELATLQNLNSPCEYLRALAHAGLTSPAGLLAKLRPEEGLPDTHSSADEPA